jgi:exodeoxyribonuclease-3
VIVAGDLNVCHTVLDMHVPKVVRKYQGKHPSSTTKEKTNFEKFLNIGFVDTFRRLNPSTKKYSWYNIKRLGREKNLGKRLDYFLVSEDFISAVTRSEVLSDIEGSDHCPIELNLDLSLITKKDE